LSPKLKIYFFYLLLLLLPFLNSQIPILVPELISSKTLVNFLVFIPYWGLGLVALLGLQLNQTRVFWAAFLIGGFYCGLRQPSFLQFLGVSPVRGLEILGVSYPLALALLFSFKESRLWSSESLFRCFLAFLPAGLLLALLSVDPTGFQGLLYWNLGSWSHWLRIPQLAWLSCAFLVATFWNFKETKVELFLGALTISLLAFYFSLEQSLTAFLTPFTPLPLASLVLSFTAITVVLLHSAFYLYWNRVYLDPLTGIPNRQALEDRLHTLSGRYTLAMMDIDHFKRFNDTYGHEEGDNVLRMVAQHLQEHLGSRAYRYGGEEFCAVFEGMEGAEALALAETTRETLEKRKFILRTRLRKKDKNSASGKEVHITISIGLACPDKKHPTYREVLPQADQALYQAKEKGRNRAILAE
jgi:diguanylate cyclase (GGDEF)-like protein